MSKRESVSGPSPGSWPRWPIRFWWDLIPGKFAPSQGGLKAPEFAPPDWLNEPWVATNEALAQARKAHDRAMERSSEAEAKSGRLLQLSLALLVLTLTIAGYQLALIRSLGWPLPTYVLIVPTVIAAIALALAGGISAEGDRPGLYQLPGAAEMSANPDPVRALVLAEERGRVLANWTATNKLNDLLQARAWLTRGLIALVVAGIISAGLQVPSTTPGSAHNQGASTASPSRRL